MKTILANVSNSFFVRNFLRTDALKVLEASGEVRLVLLAPKNKVDYYKKEFPAPFITFDILPEVGNSRVEKFFKFLETASISSKTSYMLAKSNLHRHGSSFSILRYPSFLLRMVLLNLGRFSFWRNFVRGIYYVFPNNAFDEILEKYKPDLAFFPSLIYSEDYVLAKAAKKRGVKTLGMTLSWDNFYSKTLLLVKPDNLLLHTKNILSQAQKFGDWDSPNVSAVGIPQYDRYFKKENISSREEFFRSIGADPSKKLILYAFSGKAGFNIELKIVELLHKYLVEKQINDDIQVLIRPYPRYDFPKEKLEAMKQKYGFLAASPVAHPTGEKGDWEFDKEALDFLSSSLAHADLVVTMYSTFFIEAAIFDKPLVAVGFDGEKELDYWNSAKRFFDWNHLAELRPLDGIKIVKSGQELISAINGYLSNPALDSEGRKKIVLEQCQFTDGLSGERVSKTILGLLGLK